MSAKAQLQTISIPLPLINELAIEPRPNGVKKLQGEENSYRTPAGDYCVVYDISDNILLVTVIRGKTSKSSLSG